MFQNNLRAPKRLETFFSFPLCFVYGEPFIIYYVQWEGRLITFKVNHFLSDPLSTKVIPKNGDETSLKIAPYLLLFVVSTMTDFIETQNQKTLFVFIVSTNSFQDSANCLK